MDGFREVAGVTGTDWGSPDRTDTTEGRGVDEANAGTSGRREIGVTELFADAPPVRSVHQAISCRPEDVRKPARGNSVHRGHAPNEDHSAVHHYMAHKIQKLAEQNENTRTPRGVFHKVGIHVNGITAPSWLELRDIMLANGGRFCNYYSRVTTTHIVCARLTSAKLAALKKADRNHPPVVTPAWVTQSLQQGKLLPVADFALQGTLEPGQRRIAKFAFAGPPEEMKGPPEGVEIETRESNRVAEDDDTESDPEVPEIAPTQTDNETEDETGMQLETKAENKKNTVLRVVFINARHHLESLPVGDDDARASASFAATKAASAAAYAALASTVDPARIIPVSAWEALVVLNTNGDDDENKQTLVALAARIKEALVAAGVDADAALVELTTPKNGIVSVDDPVDDPLDKTSPRGSAPPWGIKRKPSALKYPENERDANNNTDARRSGKRKNVHFGKMVVDDASDAAEVEDAPEPTMATSTRGAKRKSSFAASAAAPGPISVEAWNALPLDMHCEFARPPRDPTAGESLGVDAFGAHLGIPSNKPKGTKTGGHAKAVSTSHALPALESRIFDDGLPDTCSQIDPADLEAIGPEMTEEILKRYERAAREKHAKTRNAQKGGKGSKDKYGRGKNNAASVDLQSYYKPQRSEKNAAEVTKRTQPNTSNFQDVDVVVFDDRDDAIDPPPVVGPETITTSRDTVGAVYKEFRDDAAVDALCLELEQTVDALVAFHGEEDAQESSVSRLDTCASALTNQAIVFVQSNALEWVQRLMRRGLEVCEKSDAHALHWKPVFDQAWEKVSTEIRANYEGASLVLR